MRSLIRQRYGQAATIFRGLGLALTIAAAAAFLGAHYGAPAMLFALLIGMAFNFLAHESHIKPGVDFAASACLRLGVALGKAEQPSVYLTAALRQRLVYVDGQRQGDDEAGRPKGKVPARHWITSPCIKNLARATEAVKPRIPMMKAASKYSSLPVRIPWTTMASIPFT